MSFARLIAIAAPTFAGLLGAAAAQVPPGRIYMLHSPAAGGCPALDWHIVVEPNDIVAGMIAWNDMKTMARASGKVDRKNHTFAVTAVVLGGEAQTATVSGTIRNDGTLIANIRGPNVTCNSVVVRAFISPPQSR